MNKYKHRDTGTLVTGGKWDGRVVTAEAWCKEHGFEYEAATHRLIVPVGDGHKRVVNKDDVVFREDGGDWRVKWWLDFNVEYDECPEGTKKGK